MTRQRGSLQCTKVMCPLTIKSSKQAEVGKTSFYDSQISDFIVAVSMTLLFAHKADRCRPFPPLQILEQIHPLNLHKRLLRALQRHLPLVILGNRLGVVQVLQP